MKFDSAGKLEELVWHSRLADLPRGENRAILQRMYNGEPPFDQEKAEENGIEINRNDLTGVNLLAQARRQWNTAFLGPKNYFNVTLDGAPPHKTASWSGAITKNINKRLKRNAKMREQIRATGANIMLHGIGPVNWPDRRCPIPNPLPVSSLLISSETDIDFENLEWFAVFREVTPSQLFALTHGPKVDPGWNMPLVMNQLRRVADDVIKQPNATAYQYMPERVEELMKQDMGFWGSDAVPTIDIWDVYFREYEDGEGWYRRIILDWGLRETGYSGKGMPKSPNRLSEDKDSEFLYSSGKRCYAKSHSEIIHCQFGDTSAYAPFKYHSVRSLGWMIWGACELQNRLYCKFMENSFMNLMWWFRVSGEQAFNRIKRADFFHMGVIPNGVSMIPTAERFSPDSKIVEMAFARNRQLLAENAASFTSDFSKGESGKEMTATETMARVNSVNALVSGMLTLAYSYEEPKAREICRRFCIRNNPYRDVRLFRADCLRDGVPPEFLDSERWNVEIERAVGGGNKTLQMATVNFLNSIRQNVGPQGQRIIDNMSVFYATDQPDLAEAIAPVDEQQEISGSMHDAQLATNRIFSGLPFVISAKMIPEDYVKVWLADMAVKLQERTQTTNMATAEEIAGFVNMEKHINEFLKIMSSNEKEAPKVRNYSDTLGQMMNLVKGFAQRLAQKMQKEQQQGVGGNGEAAAELQSKLKTQEILAQAKAKNATISHGQRTAQKQVQFEMDQQRKDREQQADIRRKNLEADLELQKNAALVEQELKAERARAELELEVEREKAAIDLQKQKQQAETAANKPEKTE